MSEISLVQAINLGTCSRHGGGRTGPRAGRGCRRRRRRVPRDRWAVAALRRRARIRHAARRSGHRGRRPSVSPRKAFARSRRSSSAASSIRSIDQLASHASRFERGHAAGSPVRWCCARPAAAASAPSSTIPKATRRCSPISPGCASSSRPRRAALMGFCSPRSAIPIRWCSSSQRGSIAPRARRSTDDGQSMPLDRCFVLREGSDVTLVAWGGMVPEALSAADRLAAQAWQAPR